MAAFHGREVLPRRPGPHHTSRSGGGPQLTPEGPVMLEGLCENVQGETALEDDVNLCSPGTYRRRPRRTSGAPAWPGEGPFA